MSSANKTQNLKLNSWLGSDKPQRTDFNNDNEIIDAAVGEHTADSVIHITQAERELWNSFVQVGTYYGDGLAERTVTFDECDFDINAVIIFAGNRPMSISRFSDSKKYNYCAFLTKEECSAGVTFSSDYKSVTVVQSTSPLLSNEYMNLNEAGVAYTYILFR